MNPRNVVGLVRLSRTLVLDWKARVLLTIGIIRPYSLKDKTNFDEAGTLAAGLQPPEVDKLRRDAHGRGRAVDIGGVLLDHPTEFEAIKVKVSKTQSEVVVLPPTDPNAKLKATKKEYVAQRDFVVQVHWGNVEMLFEDDKGVKVRAKSTSKDFINDLKSSNATKRMFYRLEGLDAPLDPTVPDVLPKRPKSHELTIEHYIDAKRLFLQIYQFFCREYTHENQILEGNAAPPQAYLPGNVAGSVVHPDYPSASARGLHQNHIHANLGHNGPSLAKGIVKIDPITGKKKGPPTLGVWQSSAEMIEARTRGYER